MLKMKIKIISLTIYIMQICVILMIWGGKLQLKKSKEHSNFLLKFKITIILDLD